jgi:hypothetical protein
MAAIASLPFAPLPPPITVGPGIGRGRVACDEMIDGERVLYRAETILRRNRLGHAELPMLMAKRQVRRRRRESNTVALGRYFGTDGFKS